MSNSFFDWPAKPTADRFVAFDTVRAEDVNAAFDLVSAGFEKLPTPAQVWGQSGNYVVATGSADAWAASVAASHLTAYVDGMTLRVKFPAANTVTTPTLNLNGLGAKTIVTEIGSALAAGYIAENAVVSLTYNGSYGKWQIGSIATVSAVADSIVNVNTVAGNIASINTVAGDISSINTVAGDIENVDIVASGIANVNTVAGDIADVSTVAGISANVSTVAGIQANITAVAEISADVTTVAAVSADVSTVAAASVDVSTVAADIANVIIVADNIAVVNQAMAAGRIYADTTAGLAAVASGEYFYVPSAEVGESLILYKDNAGVAEEVTRLFAVDVFGSSTPLGTVYSIEDADGNAAFVVRDDGTVAVGALEVANDAQVLGDMAVTGAVTGESIAPTDSSGALVERSYPGLVHAIIDGDGNVALGVRDDGTVHIGSLVADDFDGEASGASDGVNRYGGAYTANLNFIITAGQSLASGSDGEVTTTQEYDNIGFLASSSPTETYALTTGNMGGTGEENPMYGTAGFIKELMLKENGAAYTDFDYQLLSVCNGQSGALIDELKKGGSRGTFEDGIGQVTAGYNIATSAARTFAFQAVTWTQGESDLSMAKDTYKATLIQMVEDYNTDGKAVTGQAGAVHLITYQLCHATGLDTVMPALLEASEDVPHIHLATPTYFLDFIDGTHVVAQSAKWLGGYYGLVYKRVLIDGKEWAPLKPIAHAVIGNCIDLTFNKEGLTFDHTIMPAQTNEGFTVFDGSSAAVTISSVEILRPNRVRITCASTPAAGWTVKYGHISVTGKANYVGRPGGNLRDSQGDYLVYDAISKPMHNWSVIFSRTI